MPASEAGVTPPREEKLEDRLTSEILDRSVSGVNLVPGTLRDQLAERTLLVFLRHFGCIFCRETVSDLQQVSTKEPGFPKTLLFFQGTPIEGRAFLRRYWPTGHAIADPDHFWYAAFGLERGNLRQLFGPGVWSARRRARSKGMRGGAAAADLWMMPGAFLLEAESVTWAHHFAHAGDHPVFGDILELAGCPSGDG